MAVVAELWKHRNKTIFNSGRVDHTKIFTMVQLKVWSWGNFKVRRVSFSYFDWCLEPLVYMRYVRKIYKVFSVFGMLHVYVCLLFYLVWFEQEVLLYGLGGG